MHFVWQIRNDTAQYDCVLTLVELLSVRKVMLFVIIKINLCFRARQHLRSLEPVTNVYDTDPRLYFHSEGSHTQDFYALKKSIDPANDI